MSDEARGWHPQDGPFIPEGDVPTPWEWAEIGRRLREPFNPADVSFRVMTKGKKRDDGSTSKSACAAYIDARDVMGRLDEVVGAGAWEFKFEPLTKVALMEDVGFGSDRQKVQVGKLDVVRGVLRIYGVEKQDVGDRSATEATKGAVGDAMKRVAVHWGIGRYLYNLSLPGFGYAETDNYGNIPKATIDEWRRAIPKPSWMGQSNQQRRPQSPPPPSPQGAQSHPASNSSPLTIAGPATNPQLLAIKAFANKLWEGGVESPGFDEVLARHCKGEIKPLSELLKAEAHGIIQEIQKMQVSNENFDQDAKQEGEPPPVHGKDIRISTKNYHSTVIQEATQNGWAVDDGQTNVNPMRLLNAIRSGGFRHNEINDANLDEAVQAMRNHYSISVPA